MCCIEVILKRANISASEKMQHIKAAMKGTNDAFSRVVHKTAQLGVGRPSAKGCKTRPSALSSTSCRRENKPQNPRARTDSEHSAYSRIVFLRLRQGKASRGTYRCMVRGLRPGCSEVPAGLCLDGCSRYYGNIHIGKPAQTITVVFDTGPAPPRLFWPAPSCGPELLG